MPQDEPDLHNFSTSPDHRLPPINGVQGLQNEIERSHGVSTGMPGLDLCLSPNRTPVASRGIRRGCVTEIYGPPGSGKSTLGMQLVAHAVRAHGKAVWLSAGTPLFQSRLENIMRVGEHSTDHGPPSSPPSARPSTDESTHGFVYREIHSLAHLLIMLMHPTALFPPPNTTTIVVDGLPNMLMSAFPRLLRGKDNIPSILKDTAAKIAVGKRHQMIENLASALSHLARSRQIAIIILNKTTTSLKGGQRALLKPYIGGHAWDAAVDTRIVLYRDLYPRHVAKKLKIREKRFYRLAEVVRLGKKDVGRDPVPFVIEKGGLRELPILGSVTEPTVQLPGFDLFEDPPLQIRTSEPGTRATVPLATQNTYPTASQIFRNESSQPSHSTPVPLPQNSPQPNIDADEDEPQSSQTRSSKRKAIEIADSEDEGDGDEAISTAKEARVTDATDTAQPPPPTSFKSKPVPLPADETFDYAEAALECQAHEIMDEALENGEHISYEDAINRIINEWCNKLPPEEKHNGDEELHPPTDDFYQDVRDRHSFFDDRMLPYTHQQVVEFMAKEWRKHGKEPPERGCGRPQCGECVP